MGTRKLVESLSARALVHSLLAQRGGTCCTEEEEEEEEEEEGYTCKI